MASLSELLDGDQPQNGMGELCQLNQEGDVKTIWDPSKPEEVDAARAQFDSLKRKGYSAFRAVGEKGEKGEQIREFDKNAGRVIMIPALAGG